MVKFDSIDVPPSVRMQSPVRCLKHIINAYGDGRSIVASIFHIPNGCSFYNMPS